jgi:hypothetical protein
MSRSNPPNAAGSRKISFNVSEQYDIQDVVGEGAYGVVWYVFLCLVRYSVYYLTLLKLCHSQAFRPKGRHQEDHSFRSLHVLSKNPARDEAVAILQPREHHLHSRHSEAPKLRVI